MHRNAIVKNWHPIMTRVHSLRYFQICILITSRTIREPSGNVRVFKMERVNYFLGTHFICRNSIYPPWLAISIITGWHISGWGSSVLLAGYLLRGWEGSPYACYHMIIKNDSVKGRPYAEGWNDKPGLFCWFYRHFWRTYTQTRRRITTHEVDRPFSGNEFLCQHNTVVE